MRVTVMKATGAGVPHGQQKVDRKAGRERSARQGAPSAAPEGSSEPGAGTGRRTGAQNSTPPDRVTARPTGSSGALPALSGRLAPDNRGQLIHPRSVSQADRQPLVILGSGMSGGVAAKTLREGGYDGRLVLIGHEPTPPFGRPPLSKTYLRGEESLSGWLVNPDNWYESNRVELVAATAMGVNVPMRQVELDAGRPIAFGKLLITTGGENRHLDLPGAKLPGVFQLRTVAESDAIKEAAHRGARALVVGMGFIGCEVTASLTQMGVKVTSVLPGAAPLESVLGPELGALMAGIHRDAGVGLVARGEVVRFESANRGARAITRNGGQATGGFGDGKRAGWGKGGDS